LQHKDSVEKKFVSAFLL